MTRSRDVALAGSMELAFNVSLSFDPAIIAGLRAMVISG